MSGHPPDELADSVLRDLHPDLDHGIMFRVPPRGSLIQREPTETQLASIMEALAKAAVTEIRKLVEDGSVELRLEVSRSHKEINRLMSKLQQVEGELRKAQEAATREIRSVGVQAEEQFKGAAGGTGAVKCGTDAFVEQLDEKKCKAQTCNRRPGFGYVVKEEEQEEEHEAPILHQTESEDSAGRLNNVASETMLTEPVNSLTSKAYSCHYGDVWKHTFLFGERQSCS
ncbi:hypothetical protein GJAV_G00093670 [Gymnothorax javanicus]|nr:hypothetical protein GJAV_G00093670 [Gymnothorax javanicus]